MASQRTSTPHLDGYLKGIRDEFDRLNDELEETRKQRDEFIAKYTSQVKELQELRQTISSRESHTTCQHGHTAHTVHACGDNTSPEYHFDGEYSASTKAKEIGHLEGEENQEGGQNEINAARTITETTLQAIVNQPGDPVWDVLQIFNGNTKAALNLNMVHKLTQEGRNRVAFSMDGKYLAAASSSGIVSIFDLKSGEKIMHKVTKDPYQVEKSLHSYRCLAFSPDSKYLAKEKKMAMYRYG